MIYNKNILSKLIAIIISFSVIILSAITLVACKDKPILPQTINVLENEPQIRVSNTKTGKTSEMDIEKYVAGVVAGEVYNTWELEALKTQAVLARTFALNFANTNPEEYKKTGIKTSVANAQSYDESTINDNILKAVKETRGEVISNNGKLINAYFHSNSGGFTTLPSSSFESEHNENYLKATKSPENQSNSKNYSWKATFTKSEVLNALQKMGINVANLSNVKLGEKDSSGYYKTLYLGGKEISAPTLRLNLSSTKMKSTKLTKIYSTNSNIILEGLGYGHGVGVSQWGAQVLATQGKNYKEILNYYFKNISIQKIY